MKGEREKKKKKKRLFCIVYHLHYGPVGSSVISRSFYFFNAGSTSASADEIFSALNFLRAVQFSGVTYEPQTRTDVQALYY